KYGDNVRVVNVPDFSLEFCGGTHVANVGQIGCFKIMSETGVAAGTRRIEAITGDNVRRLLNSEQGVIASVASSLKTNASALEKKADDVAVELKSLKKELAEAKAKAAGEGAGALLAEAKEIAGKRLVCKVFEGADVDHLRAVSDKIKQAEKNVVMVFAAKGEDKTTLIVSLTDDLVEKGLHAGKLVKDIAAVCGGGGGGKADMAQAGAKDAEKLPEAFAKAEELLK
ncbi:MAG: alanine--tRNA ligase, partial [Firmicutes bacterium]|nr:alanine--tRNA ligase [Bacillota bacterium]